MRRDGDSPQSPRFCARDEAMCPFGRRPAGLRCPCDGKWKVSSPCVRMRRRLNGMRNCAACCSCCSRAADGWLCMSLLAPPERCGEPSCGDDATRFSQSPALAGVRTLGVEGAARGEDATGEGGMEDTRKTGEAPCLEGDSSAKSAPKRPSYRSLERGVSDAALRLRLLVGVRGAVCTIACGSASGRGVPSVYSLATR